jgi:enoyl-CoA hydratase/carnithine racemase
VPGPRLRTTASQLARRLAQVEPALLRATKAAVRRGSDLPLAAALGLERRLASTIRPSSR